jgi:Ca-activated chloride channel family protein
MSRTPLFVTALLVSFLAVPLLSADPYSSVMRKGYRYYRNSLYREALGYFEQGVEKNSKSPVPHFNTAAALYKMEDYVRSIEALTEALKSADSAEQIAQIHYNLGNNHFQLGNYDKAAEHYIEALKETPYDLDTKFNLELALEKLSGQSAPAQEEVQDEKGEGGPRPAEGPPAEEGEREGSSGKQEQGTQEFSKEEAEQLVDSVNNDQSRIMNEIIQNRAGKVQYEKDW